MSIDLTKYDGHTPGPWAWDDKDYCGLDGPDRDAVLTYRNFEGMHLTYGDSRHANARLIADAPALLDEVKRLRADLAEAVAALRELSYYAETSDDCQYGTLSTRLVHNIATPVLAKHTNNSGC